MPLREEIEKQGNWLFKNRSYLPLILVPLIILAFWQVGHFNKTMVATSGTWSILCLAISFLGLAIRCLTIGSTPEGTSGRNTREQRADTLNTTGLYSVLRHPLYIGNFFIFLGVVMFVNVGWFIVFSVLAFWFYYERIIFAEEEFLRRKFGDLYLQWSIHTRLLFPNFQDWQPGNLPFSFRTILKREYSGFFGIIATFTFLKIIQNLFSTATFTLSWSWLIFFISGLLVYLTLRTLKRKTRVLDLDGR